MSLDDSDDETTPFGRAHSTICSVLNMIAPYCLNARVNSFDTAQAPPDADEVTNKCFLFGGLTERIDDAPIEFGMFLVMEIYPSEMRWAKRNSGIELLLHLTVNGHHPYSDMDRDPIF